jgi:hypothetical protein
MENSFFKSHGLSSESVPVEMCQNVAGRQGTLPLRPVVPNLWYVYPWGYAKIILVIAENKKKGVKIKTQKTKL